MTFTKLRIALGAALAPSPPRARSRSPCRRRRPRRRRRTSPQAVVKSAPRTTPAPTPAAVPNRTLRGVVRDEQGRPVAKAWVGTDPRPMQDTWDNPSPRNLRERAEPYRDEHGDVVPPGEVGKYFEVRRTESAPWQPVSPDDIRPCKPIVFGGDGKAVSDEEVAKTYSNYTVRVARGGWWMAAPIGKHDPARTDAEGRFAIEITWPGDAKLHFASADYTLQAIRPLKDGELDKPIEVTLRPTRLVRARVIEVPNDDPKAYLNWSIYTVDGAGKFVAEWQRWMLPEPERERPAARQAAPGSPPAGGQVQDRVPLASRSCQVFDFEVPPGVGPYDLPDFMLPSLASVRMVGGRRGRDRRDRPRRQAREARRLPRQGRRARLLGDLVRPLHRGHAEARGPEGAVQGSAARHPGAARQLGRVGRRLREGRSPRSATDSSNGKDLPFPVLLDRPPAGKSPRAFANEAGHEGLGAVGRHVRGLLWPSTFVIDPNGILVGKFDAFTDALEGALEDQFGLPRTKPGPGRLDRAEPPDTKGPTKVKGKVVGPDGKPVAGAKVEPQMVKVREREDIKTGPDGGFAFTAEGFFDDSRSRSRPRAWPRRCSRPTRTGEFREPLRAGLGRRRHRPARPRRQAGRGCPGGALPGQPGDGQLPRHPRDEDRRRGPVPLRARLRRRGGPRLRRDRQPPRPRRRSSLACSRPGGDGTTVDLGDMQVVAGRTLSGRVVFSDGKAIPPKTQVLASAEGAGGLIWTKVDDRGRFEVRGLPEGEVDVSVRFADIKTWNPPGYRLSTRNKCLDPLNRFRIMGQLHGDRDDLVILFEPGDDPPHSLDPGPLADFKEAKAGPITGAPPGEFPVK